MFFSQMRFDTVRYSIMASSLCVGCGLFIVTLVSSNHAHHPHQQSSVTLSPLLLFFLSCFGRKWSQSSSRTTWNNSELGALFFCPLPAGPGQLICFRSQLCVQSTVCSQQGAWRPAFVSAILLWTLYVCAPAYTHYVLQQVAVTFVLGLVFLLRMRGVERRMNRNCCEKLI